MSIKERSQTLVTFETFDQSDEETWPDPKKTMTKTITNTNRKTMAITVKWTITMTMTMTVTVNDKFVIFGNLDTDYNSED